MILKTMAVAIMSILMLVQATLADDESDFLDFLSDGVSDISTTIVEKSTDQLENFMDGSDVGVTLLGSHSSESGEYEIDAALFFMYEGYDLDHYASDDYTLEIVPTTATVTVDGKRVKVYTDLASLTYWGDDLSIIVNAVSLTYRKNKDLKINKRSDYSYLDVAVKKYISLGHNGNSDIEFFVLGEASLGGESRVYTTVNSKRIKSTDKSYIGASVEVGVSLPITQGLPGSDFIGAKTDLYLYAGYGHQKGKDTSTHRTYIGLELDTGSITKDLTITPYMDYVHERVDLTKNFDEIIKDSIVNFGVRVNF